MISKIDMLMRDRIAQPLVDKTGFHPQVLCAIIMRTGLIAYIAGVTLQMIWLASFGKLTGATAIFTILMIFAITAMVRSETRKLAQPDEMSTRKVTSRFIALAFAFVNIAICSLIIGLMGGVVTTLVHVVLAIGCAMLALGTYLRICRAPLARFLK